MKKEKRFLVAGLYLAVNLFILSFGLTYAQGIPHLIAYKGDIKDVIEKKAGQKKDKQDEAATKGKTYTLTFRIYNIETGGVALWKETHLNVPIKKEKFEVLLGSFTSLDLRFDEDYWLSIEVDNAGEINPRERMTSFGYAYMADDAWKLGGRYAEDYAFSKHSHLGEDVVTAVAEAVNADTVDGLHADQIGGVRDHGALEGLNDDDHLQYLNHARGDERYGGAGWDGLTKLETAQSHIADKNNPHSVTLEQLGHIDNNPEEEVPTAIERGEPTGKEIQDWADDITSWGHSNLVANLNADMVDGLRATLSNNPLANTLIALDANAKFPLSVIPAFDTANADTVDNFHASTKATVNYLYPLNANAKFPGSIIEGLVFDSDKLDGKDSTEFSLIGHFHTLQDLTDVSADLAGAFKAAGTAGANTANRLATMADIITTPGLWTDEGTYIYPNNVGNGFQISDTGNLKIIDNTYTGPFEPGNKLQINFNGESVLLKSQDDKKRISFDSSNNNGGVINLYNTAGDAWAVRISGYSPAPSYFNAGNVGIGTTIPTDKLEVNDGNIKFTDWDNKIIFGDISDGFIGYSLLASTHGMRVYLDTNNNNQLINEVSFSVHSNVPPVGGEDNTGEIFRVQGDGNVGIGTTAPATKLDTAGTIRSTAATTPSSGVGVELVYQNGEGYVTSFDRTVGIYKPMNIYGSRISLMADNVGIGTTEHSVTLNVNGPIYQRGAVLHADYVFEPGYQLETIEQHAQYMWQEKHLKAVPQSAKAEDGQEIVEVGARGKGVLEELEKAHIYIAQLNERLKQLEAKLKD